MAIMLRVLIVAQIGCVAFVGAAARVPPDHLWWAENAAVLAFWAVILPFPIAIFYVSRRADLPGLGRRLVLIAEAGIVCASFVAILPTAQ